MAYVDPLSAPEPSPEGKQGETKAPGRTPPAASGPAGGMEDTPVNRLIYRLARDMAKSLVAALYDWQAAVGQEFLAASNKRMNALEGRIEEVARLLEAERPAFQAARQSVSAVQAQVGDLTASIDRRVEAFTQQINNLQGSLAAFQSHLQGMEQLLHLCVGQLNRQAETIQAMHNDKTQGEAVAEEMLNLVARLKAGRKATVAKVRAALEEGQS